MQIKTNQMQPWGWRCAWAQTSVKIKNTVSKKSVNKLTFAAESG
jgi:hypothetical protein